MMLKSNMGLEGIKIRPSNALLETYGELDWWDLAVRQAQRSTFLRHRTGAVIVDKRGVLRARGCSHKRDGYKVNSVHAEQHALSNYHEYPSIVDVTCYVVTLTVHDNFANCSRPCMGCALALQNSGLFVDVIYAERTNDGGWAIRGVPFDLLTEGYLKETKYAQARSAS